LDTRQNYSNSLYEPWDGRTLKQCHPFTRNYSKYGNLIPGFADLCELERSHTVRSGARGHWKDYASVKVVPVYATSDAKILMYMAQAVKAGKLKIPIGRKWPVKDAEQGHAAVAKGSAGKSLLVVSES
jgi:hypothetical protein